MTTSLLLVGSIPCDTVEEVFRRWGGTFGAHLKYLPDGEVGDRLHWIDGQAFHVFNGHPDIETVKRPAPDPGGVERWKPRDMEDQWSFKVAPGVERVGFADPGWRLAYARDAINSYFVFKTLRRDGVIPKALRFMVALPTPRSATMLFFKDPADWPAIVDAYEAAMLAEVEMMLKHIPHEDLALQWDAAVETVDLEFGLPWLGDKITPQRYETYIDQFARLSAPVPDDVALGYHACFGTLGGWPTVKPDNLVNQVRFLNDAVARSTRRVDFVHLPMLNRTDADYVKPLGALDIHGAELYLGMIHNMDSFAERLAQARAQVSDFGIAAPCGFGRISAAELDAVMAEHEKALAILAA